MILINTKKYVFGLILLLQGFVYAVTVQEQAGILHLETLYGAFTIEEPVIIELINSSAMQRLKEIHQYGVVHYVKKPQTYNRYEHSLGVFALLRRYGAPLEEQIAGLLHDVSHTVFSHVGDLVFDHKSDKQSYQDDIHEWFLDRTGTTDILREHGYPAVCSQNNKKQYRALEQDLPDLCADRIEYNLMGGLEEDVINEEDVNVILDDLYCQDSQWFFKHIEPAKKLAYISLYLTEHVFAAHWDRFIYYNTAHALKRAIAIDALTYDDINFSIDDKIWHLLCINDDPIIKSYISTVINHKDRYYLSDPNEYDMHLVSKFRGVDPLVQTEVGFKRLTDLDDAFTREYNRVKELATQGWYIKLKKSE